jgi:hypothetical protein
LEIKGTNFRETIIMLGCNITGKLNPRVFCVLLAVFFLSLPFQSTAQVIIKERMELSTEKTSPITTASAPADEYYCCYLHIGGTYELEISYVSEWIEEFELWEEGIGKIADVSALSDGQIINLGQFNQWDHFYFYLYDPDNDNKKKTGGRVGYNFYASEKDSSLAEMPPSVALDFFGNPFIPSGEVTIQEDGYMRLDMRGGSKGEKDLYIDMPKDSLIKENIKDEVGHIGVRTVRKGEVYRFYIKSELPMVSDRKLYPKFGYLNSLVFEDWTDLRYDDLQFYVQIVEHPKTPKSIRLRSNPSDVLPNYDEKTFFSLERINKDYSAVNFPDDQTFNIKMDESKAQYATLHDPATNQEGTSLENVTANFHMDIKSYEKIGNFTGGIEVEAMTKVKDPVSDELVEISGDWDIEVVNKKMFLEFNPNPVAKGDTALVQRRLLYANGIEKQLPIDKRIPYASVHPNSRSFGTLRDIATGETGIYLYGVTGGLQFVTNSDIAQDKVEAKMVASSYVDKKMPTSELSTLSNQSLSDRQSNFDNLSTEEKRIMDQRYWESVETGNVDITGSDTPKLMESSDIGIMSHNSDQDYIYGSGSLIIGNELEPCRSNPYPQNYDLKGVRQPDGWKCDGDELGNTSTVTKHYIADIQACFSKQIMRWKGELTNVEAEINYSLCSETARNDNLEIVNGASDSDITEENYCSITKKINRTIESLQEGGEIEVYYPKATIAHEEVHVEQIKELIDTYILGKKGMITDLESEEYTLAKNKASNANEAQKTLDPYFEYLWNATKDDIHDELLDIKDKGSWEADAYDATIPPYESLLKQIKERAEQSQWKPCTE